MELRERRLDQGDDLLGPWVVVGDCRGRRRVAPSWRRRSGLNVDASLPVVAVDVDVAVDDVAACSVPVTAGVVDVVTA